MIRRPSRGPRRTSRLPPAPDRVEVALVDLVDPHEELVDVVVLRVEIAAGEGVVATRRELPDDVRRARGRRPRRVGREVRSHLRLNETRAEEEDRDAAAQLVCERLAVPRGGGLARGVRGM